MTRTVLITGGAGFIGSALARRLVDATHTVRAFDDLSMGSRAYLNGMPLQFVEASLADQDSLERALHGVTDVVHLAARAGIPDSIADPLGTFRANVTDTVELLEAARRAGVGRFVLASSNAVLGDASPPFDESVLPAPTSPYGASKLAGEAYVSAYASTFGMAACSLRFSNVYGPRSLHKKSVVATWLRSALDGGPIVVYGTGTQTRDFIFVDDLADGICAALEASPDVISGEVFQIGTGIETTVAELADAARGALGGLDVQHQPPRAGDTERNYARVDKARRRLGFEPRVTLGDGMNATAAWFRAALADPELAAIRPLAASGSD